MVSMLSSSADAGFVQVNYRHKSVGTKIPSDAGLASIPLPWMEPGPAACEAVTSPLRHSGRHYSIVFF